MVSFHGQFAVIRELDFGDMVYEACNFINNNLFLSYKKLKRELKIL